MLQAGQYKTQIEPDPEDSVVEVKVALLCRFLPYYWQKWHCLSAQGAAAVVQVRVNYSCRFHYLLLRVLEVTSSLDEADC